MTPFPYPNPDPYARGPLNPPPPLCYFPSLSLLNSSLNIQGQESSEKNPSTSAPAGSTSILFSLQTFWGLLSDSTRVRYPANLETLSCSQAPVRTTPRIGSETAVEDKSVLWEDDSFSLASVHQAAGRRADRPLGMSAVLSRWTYRKSDQNSGIIRALVQ